MAGPLAPGHGLAPPEPAAHALQCARHGIAGDPRSEFLLLGALALLARGLRHGARKCCALIYAAYARVSALQLCAWHIRYYIPLALA